VCISKEFCLLLRQQHFRFLVQREICVILNFTGDR